MAKSNFSSKLVYGEARFSDRGFAFPAMGLTQSTCFQQCFDAPGAPQASFDDGVQPSEQYEEQTVAELNQRPTSTDAAAAEAEVDRVAAEKKAADEAAAAAAAAAAEPGQGGRRATILAE